MTYKLKIDIAMRGIVAPRWGAISPMDTAIPQLRTPTARLQWPIIARPLRGLYVNSIVAQTGGIRTPPWPAYMIK